MLILLLDELLSNGLRHGHLPVTAEVRRTPQEWICEVSDPAIETEPSPAVDRDPAQGGMGLRIIASLSSSHGWFVRDARKYVWGALPAI
ncbi:ATP-binding protein [Blastococcus brunescens]|uniref:ATP-binding protein n=1 Tax=Blastococcus brunescens TaxID=1564165 RepID=A0ABZ1B535_9ACTN|nr:ATP-binding protein [Blastococcus sp. BMG 8361]WRL65925.1 ATP-binding protein [Blastococcus sp. BMG 8361]